MKKFTILCATLVAFATSSCSKFEEGAGAPDSKKEAITIGVSTTTVSYTPLRSASTNLLAVQIYEVNGAVETPYAKGLFSDYSAITFEGYTNTTYKVEATMVVDGGNQLYMDVESNYGLPFDAAVVSEVEYSSTPFAGISSSSAKLVDGTEYTNPTIDRYYGYATKRVSAEDATITTSMKRMTAGVTITGISEEVTLEIAGAPVQSVSAGDIVLFSLSNFAAAYTADETTSPYSESISTKITNGNAAISDASISYLRNCLATITVSKDGVSVGFDFETSFEQIKVLTFEDEGESTFWSSLIDTPQYEGTLLYGGTKYEWTDANNTLLHSEMLFNYGSYAFWNGAHAVSNYVEMNLSAELSYSSQLAVYHQDAETGFGGRNGSKNFCVHNGYDYGDGAVPSLSFSDGKEHIIDHMYVCNTSYFTYVATYGNGNSAALGADDYVKVIATGYDLSDNKTGVVELYLTEAGVCKSDWNKFDMSALGKVSYVKFTVDGSVTNNYGFSLPSYFAYDDVTVIL